MAFNEGCRPNYWFCSVLVNPEKYGETRDELLHRLIGNNIQARPLWDLIHRQQPYRENQAYRIEKALYYQQHLINIPCSTNLTAEEVDIVVEHLRR